MHATKYQQTVQGNCSMEIFCTLQRWISWHLTTSLSLKLWKIQTSQCMQQNINKLFKETVQSKILSSMCSSYSFRYVGGFLFPTPLETTLTSLVFSVARWVTTLTVGLFSGTKTRSVLQSNSQSVHSYTTSHFSCS